MWTSILLSNFAFADIEVSDPVSLELDGSTNVLNSSAMDSGWLPSSGMVQIRLQLSIEQDASLTGSGTSSVSWDTNIPGDLNLTAQGIGNTGLFSINGFMDMIVSVRFDIGAFSWEGNFIEQEVPLTGDAQFTPLTWEVPVVTDVVGDGSEILDYSQSLLTILTGTLSGEVRPNCTATLTENYFSTSSGDRLDVNTNSLEFYTPVGNSSLEVPMTHYSTIHSECAVQFVPALTISGPIIGSNSLEITQIDLPIIEQTTQMTIVPDRLDFALPSLSTDSTSLSFEPTDAGNSNNAEIVLSNIGYATLEGTAELIDSSGTFSLFGGDFNLNAGGSSSLVLAFEGSDSNQYYEAEVVIRSNDPAQPTLTIPISATTNPEENGEPSGETDGYTVSEGVEKPDGCSTVNPVSMWLMTIALFGIRRRQ